MKLKIYYFFKIKESNIFDEIILKMTSILNEYFHLMELCHYLMDQIIFIRKLSMIH